MAGDSHDIPAEHIEMARRLVEERMNKRKENVDSIKIGNGWAGSKPYVNQDGLVLNANDVSGDDDDAELDFEEKKNRAKIRLKVDWRGNGQNVCVAFWTGQVRGRDYHVVISMVLAHLLTLLLAGDICLRNADYSGFIYILVPIFHLMWVTIALLSNLLSSEACSTGETILLILAYVLHYVVAFTAYESMKPDDIFSAEGEYAQDFLFFYCICVPYLTSTVALLLKLRDDVAESVISY